MLDDRFRLIACGCLLLRASSALIAGHRILSSHSDFLLHGCCVATRKTPILFLAAPTTTTNPPLPNFCSNCGTASMEWRIPPGDERVRAVCSECHHIEYSNPKIVVSCVVWAGGDNTLRCLLGKRAIDPRKGYWGIPQGYMEHGETSRQAAAREVMEETGVKIEEETMKLRAVYNVPGSVQLVYEANISGQQAETEIDATTHESSEVTLFPMDRIPFEDLCFPTVQWAIDHSIAMRKDDSDRVQQMTKCYDPDSQQWAQHEDEILNSS